MTLRQKQYFPGQSPAVDRDLLYGSVALRNAARKRGVTLIEMLCVVFCLSLLIISGLALMTSGSVFFRNTTVNASAESDVTYAARFVELKLEEASEFTITSATGLGAGTRISFKDAAGADCSFALSASDDVDNANHRSLIYSGPEATGKAVLRGIPKATVVFSPTTVGLKVDRQSQMDVYRRITVTLPRVQKSASGSGGVRLVSQRAVLRVVPRNIFDDINGNQ
ncbi:MAG: prepilin-type N-terminal cleavage/methylation domain-containing protein [Armatimonadota bacterium]